MSAKSRQLFAARMAPALADIEKMRSEPGSAERKNLARIFTYLPERDGRGPWIVVGQHDLDRLGLLKDILVMASVSGEPDKKIVHRAETFCRYELKKEWADKVISVFQQEYKQRQDLEATFR